MSTPRDNINETPAYFRGIPSAIWRRALRQPLRPKTPDLLVGATRRTDAPVDTSSTWA